MPDPGSGMEKIWIRDKHPGSATLGVWRDLFRIQIKYWVNKKNLNYKAEAWLSTVGCTL